MKYKPGDVVRVTNLYKLSNAAARHYGKEYVIGKIDENIGWYNGDKGAYILNGLFFREDWLELVEQEKNIDVSENEILEVLK